MMNFEMTDTVENKGEDKSPVGMITSAVEWVQECSNDGLIAHLMMRVMADRFYSVSHPSLFVEPIKIDVKHVDKEITHTDGLSLVYTAEFVAFVPVEHGLKPLRLYLTGKEQNPTLEAIEQLETILQIGINIAINGLHVSIGDMETYAELAGYAMESL